MKDTVMHTFVCRLLMPMALLLFSHASLCGQSGEFSAENIRKSASWLDNTSLSKLESIAKWEKIKNRYNDSIAVRNSLRNRLKSLEDTRKSLADRRQDARTNMGELFRKKTGSASAGSLLQCDTTVLLLQRGIFGDSLLERKNEALIMLVKAGELLAVPYDEKGVAGARETLKLYASDEFPEEYKEIDSRLAQYGEITECVHDALKDAGEKCPKFEEKPEPWILEQVREEFFNALSKYSCIRSVSPDTYPYLYGILKETMEIKMKDPTADIN